MSKGVQISMLPDWLRRDVEEFLSENPSQVQDEYTQEEVLRMYLEWNGIIGYTSRIRAAVFHIMSSSGEYLTTTDIEQEKWLREAADVPRSVEL